MTPTASILIIGNEILSGRTQDANVPYIARRLGEMGIAVREVRVVPDVEGVIVAAVNELRGLYSYVFTTGGIGPTHDDITIPCIAKAFGVAVERSLKVEEHLRQNYGNRATSATYRMADYPAGARIIWHTETWAPGCVMDNVFILAGVPKNMQMMFESAAPLLTQGAPIHSRSVDLWAYESAIADPLEGVQKRFPAVDIGSYPYRIDGKVGTSLVVRGADAAMVEGAYKALLDMVADMGLEQRAA